MEFVGREFEIAGLETAFQSDTSEMVAVLGRRRVGKTSLIRHVFPKPDFSFTGVHNLNKSEQIREFLKELDRLQPLSKKRRASTWMDAFNHLSMFLSGKNRKRKVVIVLDELPWMDSPKANFTNALSHFWNTWAETNNVLLVICGSAASWMIKHVVNHRGGLHNRINRRIWLNPFTLHETAQFLKKKGCALNKTDIAKLYMVFGGIPYYLQQINKGESFEQIVDSVCLMQGAPLQAEFQNLYASLFGHFETHVLLVKTLATSKQGLTRLELLKRAEITDGGTVTRMLQELEASSFIQVLTPFGKNKKDAIYRLIDNFSVFALTFMSKQGNQPKGWLWQGAKSGKFFTWQGYAFENLCLQHMPQIEKKLGIQAIQTWAGSFYFKGNEERQGAQIDLVLERADQIIHLCEMKFTIGQFTITSAYRLNLLNKLQTFLDITGTKKSVFLTMITSQGIFSNANASNLLQNEVVLSDLFLP